MPIGIELEVLRLTEVEQVVERPRCPLVRELERIEHEAAAEPVVLDRERMAEEEPREWAWVLGIE
jgi:hypothetical protein